jgi:hypothetical protein
MIYFGLFSIMLSWSHDSCCRFSKLIQLTRVFLFFLAPPHKILIILIVFFSTSIFFLKFHTLTFDLLEIELHSLLCFILYMVTLVL